MAETVDPGVDESELEEPLTPAELDRIGNAARRATRILSPTARRVVLPESYLKSIASAARFTDAHRAIVLNAARPFLDMQKQFGLSTQGKFAGIVAQLTKSIDFGVLGNASKIAGNFVDLHASWLKDLGPALAAMRATFYPKNLREVEDLDFDAVETLTMSDGIPLYGIPRAEIAASLIGADSMGERRRILGTRWKPISADCRAVIDSCSSRTVARHIPFARLALDALDAGHTAPAQALAASLIDTIVTDYFGKDRTKYTPHPKGKRTTDAYYELTIRDLIAFAPIWQAYQQFDKAKGDKVPTTFSRHASAHSVSARQYSRRNAVQGLMLVCSLLYRIDETAAALESAA